MTKDMQSLTLLLMPLLLLASSETIRPLHEAFGPLKAAFGDQFPHLMLFGETENRPSPQQRPSSSIRNDFPMHSNRDIGIHDSLDSFFSKAFSVTSPPTTSPKTSASLETQTTAFNLKTFTFNRNNTRKVDDIFSVLSDVRNSASPNSLKPGENVKTNQLPSNEEEKPANDYTKKILSVVKNIENVLSTMNVMKGLYQTKKETLKPLPSNTSATNVAIASVVDLLLDVPTLEGIRTAGLTARSEEEFLDYMSSVLLGAETRSSALTLDPVTVIALLTLAAYLIRAVYQIITVTGRSLDVFDGNMNLVLSDLPDTMVRLHNWLSASAIDFERDDRVSRAIKEEITIPGDVAAVVKLYRGRHSSCVREFLCQQVQYRPVQSLTLSDIVVGGVSYYYGEPSLSRYIDGALISDRDATCTSTSNLGQSCSPNTLNDATSLQRIFTNAAEKVLGLFAVYSNWL